MNAPPDRQFVRTAIWMEEPEDDNEFATRRAHCHGFDVFGEVVGHCSWPEFILLLFRGEPPRPADAALLESLAVALANPGPRDPAVHAAMCGGVGGSPVAASLMAALAVGAGGYGGGQEVARAIRAWQECGTDLTAWRTRLAAPTDSRASIWPPTEHPPGFDPHGVATPAPVRQTLSCLAGLSPGCRLPWLAANAGALEAMAGLPLAMSGIAAATLADLGFAAEQGEALYLILRLPGAAAHALEQRAHGYKEFPFFAVELEPGCDTEAAR